MAARLCPCGSSLAASACCAPLLRGGEAPDPVALMRSRYTAFATGDVDYLWRTLDAAHADRLTPRADVLRSLAATCRRVRFLGLRVLDQAPADESGTARVLFSVRAFERGQNRSFHERSRFRHDAVGWRYLDGVLVDGEAPVGLTLATFRGGSFR